MNNLCCHFIDQSHFKKCLYRAGSGNTLVLPFDIQTQWGLPGNKELMAVAWTVLCNIQFLWKTEYYFNLAKEFQFYNQANAENVSFHRLNRKLDYTIAVRMGERGEISNYAGECVF